MTGGGGAADQIGLRMSSRNKCADEFLKVKVLEGEAACETCKQRVKDEQQGLQCDGCEKWFHRACENVSSGEYKYLSMMEELMWFCRRCKSNYKTVREENKNLREENRTLRQENEVLKRRLMQVEARVENVEREMKTGLMKQWKEVEAEVIRYTTKMRREERQGIIDEIRQHIMEEIKVELQEERRLQQAEKQEIIKEVRGQILEEVMEREQQQSRLKNLVIYGVNESVRDDGKQREIEDTEFCRKMFAEELNLINVQIEGVIRLGKRNQSENNGRVKPRPMLVKLSNSREKFDVLKRGKLLKQSREASMRRIFIAPDLTRKEREVDQQLRNDLREKQQNGERGWYISKGKLLRNFQ